MHIPDNFLSTPVWVTLDALALPAVTIVSSRAQRATEPNRLPLMGVMGAFVFAAQMINFPVGIGTSGHLVGGTLLACLLGPWTASLVVTAILIVQALVFQDGGVLALGANVFNMALIGVLVGYLPARWFSRTRWNGTGVFLGGMASVLASGILALTELQLSGIHISPTLQAISGALFAVNAAIEGALTLSVLRAIERLQPAAGYLAKPARSTVAQVLTGQRTALSWTKVVISAMLVAVLLAIIGILIASRLPDGLEHLAQALRIPFGVSPIFRSPLNDYQIQALGSGWLSRAVAGLFGLILIYILCAAGGHVLGRLRRSYP